MNPMEEALNAINAGKEHQEEEQEQLEESQEHGKNMHEYGDQFRKAYPDAFKEKK